MPKSTFRFRLLLSLLVIAAVFVGCEKEPRLIPNNNAPNGDYVPTVLIENYVNRMYIDLLGREALDAEMQRDVQLLRDDSLGIDSRTQIIYRLQHDTIYVPGDSSYKHAYYQRLYELGKQRVIEGIEDDYMTEERGMIYSNRLNPAVMSGDSAKAAEARQDIEEINLVLSIATDYRKDSIGIELMFRRLINNFVYDIINMNTFNFVNATFDNLFYRYPTMQEYNIAYEMIENNQGGSILGMTGQDRSDYLDIVTNCRSFYEGVIIWTYQSLVGRNPTPTELAVQMDIFYIDHDFQALQLRIMVTDEYANFE
jgi:hypothetical protein